MPFLARPRGRTPAERRRLPLLSALVPAAIVLAFVVLAGAAGAARGLGPLPACRYDDILTSPRGYGDWAITLVDTILRVPQSYEPPDLVSVGQAGIEGTGRVRALVINDLRAMADAARAADAGIGVQSAYRSYDQQRETFQYWVEILGRQQALRVSARPGHSEHQLGLAIDFRSESGGSPFEGDWGETKAGTWMAANSWKYGFVLSYPKGKRKITCYDYESWHFRYVGRDLAAEMNASGLTIREYLWSNFTTAVVPPPSGQPLPTYVATPRPTPTPEPTPTVDPSPSVSPSAPSTPEPTASPTGEPSTEPSPSPTEPPDSGPIGTVPAELAAAAIAGLALALGLGMLLARRGRFGVGL